MVSFFRYYLPYFKEYIPHFILAFLGMALVAAGTAATAYLIKPVLDGIFVEKDREMLAWLPLLMLLAYSGKALGTWIQAYMVAKIGQDIVRRIRDKLLEHVLEMDLAFFRRFHSGELISRISNDITRIQTAVSSHTATLIREGLTALALLYVVIYQSPKLAFYGLIVLPVAYLPLTRITQRMRRISRRSQEKNADLTSHLGEMFGNIELIKVSNTESYEAGRFAQYNRQFYKVNLKGVRIGAMVVPFMDVLGALAGAMVIFIGGLEVIESRLTAGAFFSFLTALFMLYNPVRVISNTINQFQDAYAAHERLLEVLAINPGVPDGTGSLGERIDCIQFENASLKYDNAKILSEINLSVDRGERIALVGDSGAGKSSFVNLLARFYDPSEGRVLFNGRDIREIRLNALHAHMAMVTQRVYIFNDTVAANVAYGQEIDRGKVEQALEKAHATEFVSAMEAGLDTVLDESGNNLSGGQRQRIAIARAFYKDPDILVLDEATSALDNKSESAITQALNELADDRITFVVSHRLGAIESINRILVFAQGRIICEGNRDTLLESCAEFRSLYQSGSIR